MQKLTYLMPLLMATAFGCAAEKAVEEPTEIPTSGADRKYDGPCQMSIESVFGDATETYEYDADGNMVSLIQSNYRGMGSGMTPGDLGFVLQNRAELFVLDESHANALEPGKRPFHTIIPAFVMKDGEPFAQVSAETALCRTRHPERFAWPREQR